MEIRDIKSHLSILTVLSSYNLKPNKNNMLACPFHEDKAPSLKIYTETNTFNCFGCGANGDVIEFIQRKESSAGSDCSKHQALLKATELAGQINNKLVNMEIPKPKHSNTEILEKIFGYFQNGLKSGIAKKPKEYLINRGLWPLSGVEVGYNSGQFHHRDKLSEADKQACIDAGLLIPYDKKTPNASGITYSPFAKDCIIFPLKNSKNQITGIYGRSITDNHNAKHYYLKDRQGLYPGYPNPNTPKLILTEAIIDAATLRQCFDTAQQSTQDRHTKGVLSEAEVLALYGTNGLTEEHKTAIRELHKLKEVIFFFDGHIIGDRDHYLMNVNVFHASSL